VLDRHNDAIKEYQEITKKNPKDAGARMRLGDAFRHTERTQEALVEYQQALTEFSRDADFRPHYVVSHLNLAAATFGWRTTSVAMGQNRMLLIQTTSGFSLPHQ
jgi:tetratricopeptide (TPR) repeat protein